MRTTGDGSGGEIRSRRPAYRSVTERQFDKRFRASPDYVQLVSSTDEAVSTVQEAVREGLGVVVTIQIASSRQAAMG